MTRVKVPSGKVVEEVKAIEVEAGLARPTPSPLTRNRSSRYRFDLLDSAGRKFGDLDGVLSGTVDWAANSQVKGGGKITVSKANDVHKKDIRVARNFPVLDEVDFESGTEEFYGNGEFTDYLGGPKSITRTTDTFYEGGAALDIEWGAPSGKLTKQNVVRGFDNVVTGEWYTFVARVLNTSCKDVTAKVSFTASVAIAQGEQWQTIAVPFRAPNINAFFGIQNNAPVDGTHVLVDNVVLYEGKATGYNGEVFEYAPFSWLHARVRPVLLIDGMPEEPLGVFIPSAPVEAWDDGGGQEEIELLDRTSVLSQDYTPTSYTVKKGTNVISAVRKLIASTGEDVGALTPSSETLTADMMWGAGTNKLTIVNDLLDAAGFFALWADGNGQFRVEEYKPPKSRGVTYQLLDNNQSIYLPQMSIDRDIYSVPNRVIMTAQGDGESEGWTSVATNMNPNSWFSYQNRGRWITDVQLGIEATSKEALDTKAKARLSSLSASQASISIQHAPVPGLRVNDVVRFRRTPADVDTLFTVTKTSINFDPTALAGTTLTEVVDL